MILTVSKNLAAGHHTRSCGRVQPPAGRLKTILKRRAPSPPGRRAGGHGAGSWKKRRAGAFLKQVSALRPGDPAKIFKFAAGLPRDSHKAREEVKMLLDLLLARTRAAWSPASGPAKTRFTALLRRTLDLRRMADRNVSYHLLLETALLESERAGIKLEDLVKP